MATDSLASDFFQLFASSLGMMDAVFILIGVLLMVLMRGGRQKKVAAPSNNKSSSVWKSKKTSPGKHYDSDIASLSTDVGDFSASEFSDKSNYSDASGRRYAPGAPRLRRQQGYPASSGLNMQPTQGLNARAASFAPGTATPSYTGSGLNADAACFVPSTASFATATPSLHTMLSQGFPSGVQQNSQQLRDSIKLLKGALDEWEANLPPEDDTPVQLKEKSALLEALANLTPDQAKTVRTMLDGKLASCCPQTLPQRSFTPFGGTRPPWSQAKAPRANVPKVTSTTTNGIEEESLRTQLRDLAQIENARVLMVRRINRLGLESAVPLREHFMQFGSVDRVLVAPTRSKAQAGQSKVRVRPAPLGFVVMGTAEEAEAALAHGEDQDVAGSSIGVFPFTSHTIESEEQD